MEIGGGFRYHFPYPKKTKKVRQNKSGQDGMKDFLILFLKIWRPLEIEKMNRRKLIEPSE